VPRAEGLAEHFNRHNYTWPPGADAAVPSIEVTRLPKNLDRLVVQTKKSIFFRSILPLVLAENHRIEAERAWLMKAFDRGELTDGSSETAGVEMIAKRYRVRGDINARDTREKLLKRVETLPPALVLAQAAIESGWGTSRFALKGNSLFGEWTYKGTTGIVPKGRDNGKTHSIRAFPDLRASVRSYMHNINVSRAYGKLRIMRGEMRAAGTVFDPIALAGGLSRYSQRGEGPHPVKARLRCHPCGLRRIAWRLTPGHRSEWLSPRQRTGHGVSGHNQR
jgi:Bax protein